MIFGWEFYTRVRINIKSVTTKQIQILVFFIIFLCWGSLNLLLFFAFSFYFLFFWKDSPNSLSLHNQKRVHLYYFSWETSEQFQFLFKINKNKAAHTLPPFFFFFLCLWREFHNLWRLFLKLLFIIKSRYQLVFYVDENRISDLLFNHKRFYQLN